jgi:CheY-like chemotaxis protein
MANNGLEALQIITTSTFARDAPPGAKEFDVCLLDIEMPIMDGITACHRLRELEQSGHIITHVPIIAVTANARQEQIDRMLQEGFDDVLTKPFRVPNLLSTVETLLRKNVQKD